jgi:hypothetical protein
MQYLRSTRDRSLLHDGVKNLNMSQPHETRSMKK